MCVCRPQQGFRDFRGTFSVMEARILFWMVSGEDVFYPSSGVCHLPLVRQEDAPFAVGALIKMVFKLNVMLFIFVIVIIFISVRVALKELQ